VIEKSKIGIRVLDPHVANKIAAGEVIERPASVVKELLENALDAHAKRVEVFVEKGGSRLVRVVDDGWGMSREDLAAAFLPHATSKLTDVEDLESIATLGFRGEALASVGAVAQARILSRLQGEEAGFAVENRGGDLQPPRATGAAPGTEVSVRNLFFNTPARARFLRTVRTELGHIEDLVIRFALAFPEVGFRLVHDGTELLSTEPDEGREGRLRRLCGAEIADALLPVRSSSGAATLEGYISGPSVNRPNARDMHFFVNGRHIRDKILHRVVRDAYRDVLHPGRYPVVFLFFEIDPAQVDVNVHPTKAEVRWRDARFLHSVVAPALAGALRGSDHAASLQPDRTHSQNPHEAGVRSAMADYLRRADRIHEGAPQRPYAAGSPQGPSSGGSAGRPGGEAPQETGARPEFLSVFQVHDSYLVCEVDDGIAIVDQHALHERLQYDRILDLLVEGGVEAQGLLVPEQVDLPAADRGLLEERRDLLRRCGFDWSPFGEASVALETIPSVIPREKAVELLRDLIELLRARGSEIDSRTLFHDLADTMACKAAVRFGDRLSREEAAALLEQSGALERAFVCPHGRPTVLRLSFEELEKRFGRR
jgi:DNA mismatch repair protein MutL